MFERKKEDDIRVLVFWYWVRVVGCRHMCVTMCACVRLCICATKDGRVEKGRVDWPMFRTLKIK